MEGLLDTSSRDLCQEGFVDSSNVCLCQESFVVILLAYISGHAVAVCHHDALAVSFISTLGGFEALRLEIICCRKSYITGKMAERENKSSHSGNNCNKVIVSTRISSCTGSFPWRECPCLRRGFHAGLALLLSSRVCLGKAP